MSEPRWLSVSMVLAFHSNQIQEHGGGLGLRDRGALESALDRPRTKRHHAPETPVFVIEAEEPEFVRVVLALATGDLDEKALAESLSRHTDPA